ncbi:hypothetical protein H1C71_024518, partial [Ictidomys tridecemlineatus]
KNATSRGWFRSIDLWVMGPARFRCATLLPGSGSSFRSKYLPSPPSPASPVASRSQLRLSSATCHLEATETPSLQPPNRTRAVGGDTPAAGAAGVPSASPLTSTNPVLEEVLGSWSAKSGTAGKDRGGPREPSWFVTPGPLGHPRLRKAIVSKSSHAL